ncbi:MAG: hypothetical protein RIT23_954 [Actinomycetota bacterium]
MPVGNLGEPEPQSKGYSTSAMSQVSVERVASADEEILAACHRLIPQLSSSSAPIALRELQEIVSSEVSVLFAARVDSKIVGLLTLVVFRIPTAVRAWIEDVVVDDKTDGMERLQPRRPDETQCTQCFLLVRNSAPGCPVEDDACPLFK